ncbi:hypothetical protein [Oceanisphaera ostreae]|uniref:Transcriptional regulator n=1 Tax=Oceanisphaera ostreae TaxID=914151 RepID=A0ABW3KD74_9GAMM
MSSVADVVVKDTLGKLSVIAGRTIDFDRELFIPEEYGDLYPYMSYYDDECCDSNYQEDTNAPSYSLSKAVKSLGYIIRESYERLEDKFLDEKEGFVLSDNELSRILTNTKLLYFISMEDVKKEVKVWIDYQIDQAYRLAEQQ